MRVGRVALPPRRATRSKPDLLVSGGQILNVYTGEILKGDIVVQGAFIQYVGPPSKESIEANEVIRAEASYVIPGFFDPHAHTDILFNPASFANQVILTGTTSLFSDSHDLAASLGFSGLKTMLKDFEKYPIKFFSGVPAAIPPFPSVEGRDLFGASHFKDVIQHPLVLGVSEISPWTRILRGDRALLARIREATKLGKRVEGHTLGASYAKLNRLVYEGITSCHEAMDWREALDRLRLGLFVMLRHGSIRSDLESLSLLFKKRPLLSQNRVMLTPDTRFGDAIVAEGYMDFLVHEAVRYGVDPISAIRMTTLNPAAYFGLDHLLGGIAPGRIADLLVVKDLARPTPDVVIERGRVAVTKGSLTIQPAPPPRVGLGERPFRIKSVPREWMEVATSTAGTIRIPAIHILDRTVTGRKDVTLPVRDGRIQADANRDILKVCLIQRDGKKVGKGFLSGLGLKGAVASSVSHEVHDLMVIGAEPEEMWLAAERVLQMGGGIALAREASILQTLPLPIGGIMSPLPLRDLSRKLGDLNRALTEMGSRLEYPLLTLGFLSFTSILDLRITVSGVYSVKEGKLVF